MVLETKYFVSYLLFLTLKIFLDNSFYIVFWVENWNEIKISCNFMRCEKNYLVICGKSSIVLAKLNKHCLICLKIEMTKMKLEQERIN